MVKELIVHLGDTKTGSTSIQQALVQQAYDIRGTSICYPAHPNHNVLVRTLLDKRRMQEQDDRFQSVYKKLSASSADVGVISAEHFQFADPEVFAKVARLHWPDLHADMRLITYIRPHHEKLLSSFSERVKLGQAPKDFNAFADDVFAGKLLDYLPRLQAWREVFGERFEVRPFVHKELYQQDVVADFFRYLLGHEDFSIPKHNVSNGSLTLPQLALLRLLHRRLTDIRVARGQEKSPEIFEARSALGRTVSEHIGAQNLGAEGAKLCLPATLVGQIQDRYRADSKALDREFFSGSPMTAALDACGAKATTERQSLKAADYFTPETLASFRAMVDILAKMLLDQSQSFLKMAVGTRLMFDTFDQVAPGRGAKEN